ncbi:class I adenylate-forming enzyme family protein [Lysinibacillus sp. BW-2-10]|uniref:class I adenylate-forming enzyme family protein n=1 Tax=Lysinibacillus sp. BW-2-10 TaxID=2590030 RepID=UPI00117F8CAC|nr:AMP-binding protein [Lysinibacillus sp. BW-2-10]TSI09088.1 long-chain fatty acid--CoA ligase [Lysinibacillus sp. BW-2-10]
MLGGQDWILKRARLTPDKIALIDIQSNRKWTYEQLSIETLKWLAYLQNQKIQKGERVAFLAENRIDLFPLLFACGLGEYIFVPLNWRLSEHELSSILDDCTPTILFTDDKFAAIGKRICPNTQAIKNIDGKCAVFSHSSSWKSSDPLLIIYTGGTTGKPKGVVLSFEAINWNAMNTIISWGLEPSDCTLNYMPLFHTGGLNALSLPILMVGGTVVIGQRFEPEEAIRAIDEYKTTISLFVPTMYQAMVETTYFKQSSFPTVKVFLSGGAPCPKTIYQYFMEKGLKFKEGYGLTEAGPNNFYIPPEVAAKKVGSVGKCMLFNAIQIQNEKGTLCHTGEVGELYIKGKHMFTHYWNNPEETTSALSDGWLKTGDLAKMDEHGDIYIVGRRKDMIITGGENVYPQEVEQCLITHPKVKEVAVVGVHDSKWGEAVTAFLVASEVSIQLKDELVLLCREQLAGYKVPKSFHFVSELPKTHVGKIDKKQLVERSV